jgi:hypothetical protein
VTKWADPDEAFLDIAKAKHGAPGTKCVSAHGRAGGSAFKQPSPEEDIHRAGPRSVP